ncbi:MAG: RnfABCDGE type electron transport complex subunit D [Oscillospiraceae bacterium]|nr:RnfABCDGE type electron transport complex subunit D [Oscillospiraceae bacterium]
MTKQISSRPVRRPEYWLILGSLVFVAVCFYGIRAAAVIGLAAVTAMITDLIVLFWRGRAYRSIDVSNIGNAIVLALLFPATVPYSIVIISTVFGTVIGAHVFGYRRDLVFPPSAVGYLLALTCWKDEILQFPEVGSRLALFGNEPAVQPSFTALFNEKGSIYFLHEDILECLIGAVPGPMGTGCVIMLLLGIVILIARRQLDLFAVLGGILNMTLPVLYGRADHTILLTNMLLFSLIFFIGDRALMPCRGLAAFLASGITCTLTGFLITAYHLEYAPVIAVILTCPLWRWFAAIEKRTRMLFREQHKDRKKEASENGSAKSV